MVYIMLMSVQKVKALRRESLYLCAKNAWGCNRWHIVVIKYCVYVNPTGYEKYLCYNGVILTTIYVTLSVYGNTCAPTGELL